MSCSRQPGAFMFIQFIEDFSGEHVSQRDWHELRGLAKAEVGDELSRARASREEIEETAVALATSIQLENDDPKLTQAEVHALQARCTMLASISRGTTITVRYIAEHGVKTALKNARSDEDPTIDPDRPFHLHGTTVDTVSREEDGSVTYIADYNGRDQREIYVSPELDESGYRDIEVEGYEGLQILAPEVEEKRFVANLFMLARDAEYSFGVTDITHIDVPKQ